MNDFKTPDGAARSPLLEKLARRSAAVIVAERLWRAGAALTALALFFLALSFAGLWLHLGVLEKMIGVASFGAAGLFVFLRALLLGGPKRREALARLDSAAQPGLRPAASLDDSLAGAAPEETRALWAVHRRRLEAALRHTPIAPPDPRVEERDPYALRALALVAAAAAGFSAGDEKAARLAAAFDWRGSLAFGSSARVDAWLDPPPYTGRPPIVLPGQGEANALSAPAGSVLHVRSTAGAPQTSGALETLPAAPQPGKTGALEGEREDSFKLAGPAEVSLPDGRSFKLSIIPDRPPGIKLAEPPRANARGSLTLNYKTEDDYGVVGAEAVFSRLNGPRTLYPPPRLPMTLPASRDGLGGARATLDLADNPWAGAKATLTLAARDEGGNEGLSDAAEIALPQRRFANPLARALVEQRRNLALDPERERARVFATLQALAFAPDFFDTPSSIYLGLRAARRGLEGRRSYDDLRGVADMLWAMALSLEDGDQSQAERDLRAAQENLRAAMARGADEEEIAELTKELRAAMDRFLQAMAEQAKQNQEKGDPGEGSDSARSVSEQDLQAMLDELNKAMKSGDMAKAQQLLDELQDIMENIRPSKGGPGGQRQREMSKALSELDRLSREEQQLRDETYREQQGQDAEAGKQPAGGLRSGGRPGGEAQDGAEQGGEQGNAGEARGGAREKQQALRERLERQQKAAGQAGGDAAEELESARKSMKEAEEALKPGGGGRGKAVDAQGRAVQALRRGADKLAEQMRNEGQEGGEQAGASGEGGRTGRARGRAQGEDRDPLGRSGSRRGDNANAKYDPLGLPPALRAHKVQEELRRRLGQPERPIEELDYLQRLLRR